MGSTNIGDQILTFDYREEGRSQNFNRINYKLLPVGIYEGGTVSKTGTNELTLAPGVFYLYDNVRELSVRVETTSNVAVTLDEPTGKLFLVITLEWNNVEENYADIEALSKSEIDTLEANNDSYIIAGKGDYIGGTLSNTIDTTRRTNAIISDLDITRQENFRVQTTEFSTTDALSNKVYVNPGTAIINDQNINFTGGESAALTDTTDGRIDLICIDEDGSVIIEEGTDAASPSQPNFPKDKIVVGIVNRSRSSATEVYGSEITQVRPDRIFNIGNSNSYAQFGSAAIETSNSIKLMGEFHITLDNVLYSRYYKWSSNDPSEEISCTNTANDDYLYAYLNNGVLDFELIDTEPEYDATKNYWVKTGDDTRRFVGVVWTKSGVDTLRDQYVVSNGANIVVTYYDRDTWVDDSSETEPQGNWNDGLIVSNQSYATQNAGTTVVFDSFYLPGYNVREIKAGMQLGVVNYSQVWDWDLFVSDENEDPLTAKKANHIVQLVQDWTAPSSEGTTNEWLFQIMPTPSYAVGLAGRKVALGVDGDVLSPPGHAGYVTLKFYVQRITTTF